MEKFIDINGITMCYEETGEGKPLMEVVEIPSASGRRMKSAKM